MPLLVLSALIQILLVVHVVKTGRDFRWIWLILLVPMIGSIAYLIVEVLPSLGQSPSARRAMRKVNDVIDPGRGLRQGALEYKRSQNVETTRQLAGELTRARQYDQAIELYRSALAGLFEHDPTLLLGLASTYFEKADYASVRETLDRLRYRNPEFKAPDGHLLYARALEGEGRLHDAAREYAAVAAYYPGAEARVREALLFKRRGRRDEAQQMLQAILDDASLAPRHFQKSQKEWLELARREATG